MKAEVDMDLDELFHHIKVASHEKERNEYIKSLQLRYQLEQDSEWKRRIQEFDATFLIPMYGFTKLPPDSISLKGIRSKPTTKTLNAENEGSNQPIKKTAQYRSNTNWSMLGAIATVAGLILAVLLYVLAN